MEEDQARRNDYQNARKRMEEEWKNRKRRFAVIGCKMYIFVIIGHKPQKPTFLVGRGGSNMLYYHVLYCIVNLFCVNDNYFVVLHYVNNR